MNWLTKNRVVIDFDKGHMMIQTKTGKTYMTIKSVKCKNLFLRPFEEKQRDFAIFTTKKTCIEPNSIHNVTDKPKTEKKENIHENTIFLIYQIGNKTLKIARGICDITQEENFVMIANLRYKKMIIEKNEKLQRLNK